MAAMTPRSLPRFALAAAFPTILGTVAAQPAPHTTTIPQVATGAFFGSASSFPLGRTGGRAQYWFRGSNVAIPSVVTMVGPRPARNYTGSPRSQSLEVTMSNTSLPHSGFSNVFAQNLGSQATVVYARRNLAIPAVSAHQDPDQPGVWIVLDAPFVLTGPNLVLDFDLGTAVGATSASYNGDLLSLSAAGKHLTSDPSCGGSLVASSTAASYGLRFSGPPLSPTTILLSANATTFAGVPLPLRLDFMNMNGCLLSLDPQVGVSGATDAAGAFSLSLPFAFATARVIYAQAAHASSVNPVGIATSNLTRSILGSNEFCSYIYNFTVDGSVAQNGPFNWQGAMLLQP